jgi:hypothetical protein
LAQDPARGVVKLASETRSATKIGSGICIDTPCLHVVTAYHVVALLGGRIKVEGVPVASVLAATGPQDRGSVEMNVAGSVFRFNPSRDVALLTLRTPLPARFIGLTFASGKPSLGQPVTRIARHGDAYDTASGKVVANELRHESMGYQVGLDGYFLLDCSSRPGNSGGAVIDAAGRVLGLVEIRSIEENGRIGTAVMGSSVVSGFLKEKDPALWARLFDKSSAIAASTQKQEIGWPVELDRTPVLNRASDPNVLIGALRTQVATGLAGLKRMIVRQSMRFWGDGQREEAWQYQVSMYYDGLRFRSGTGKELGTAALPSPKVGVLPGSDWYDTLSLIARVRLQYVGASSHLGDPVHVFAFQNSASDETCRFRQRTAILLGHKDEERYVPCEGIVVSDDQFNVLGIMLRISPQFGCVTEWQALARYGLVKLRGSQKPFLLPLSLDLSTRFKNGGVHHASEDWSDYRLFAAESVLRSD